MSQARHTPDDGEAEEGEHEDGTTRMHDLRGFSSCDVSDALIKLGIPHGGHITDLHMYAPIGRMEEAILAPIFTMVHASDLHSPRPSEHFVDACPEGHIILIQAPQGMKNACWGGLLSTAARARGVPAVVVDGGIRDVMEHNRLGVSVHARFRSTVGQGGFVRPSQWNVPLDIHPLPPHSDPPFPSVHVEPGDYMFCHEDGCVVIPKDRLDEVVQMAKKLKVIDEGIEKDLAAGRGVGETFKKWRG